jgi:transposase InsO family protein
MDEIVLPSRRWAEFRFSVIGHLLASPPPPGQLQEELKKLSLKVWNHPQKKTTKRFSLSTIERWYYLALKEKMSPLDKLQRKIRSDLAASKVLSLEVRGLLKRQIEEHKSWSMKLHGDNISSVIRTKNLGKPPSYSSVRRFLKKIGYQQRSRRKSDRMGQLIADLRLEKVETRSYENPYVGGLWHLDFHKSSREIITASGEIVYPNLLGIIDDHSRLICHLQWYLNETAECLIHGFMQALQKRGLPRSLMSDNGSAMTSKEFTRGLGELGILHETTLPYSPQQNGKQEVLWSQVEGRLMAMLENKKTLTLKELNEATIAWAEIEYNKKDHSEIKATPLSRFLNSKGVLRTCPESKKLRDAFRNEEVRKVRRSDGTIPIEGVRFEIPSRYRHLEKVRIRYARWDLSLVDLTDENTGAILCQLHPLNKAKNSSGERKSIEGKQDLAITQTEDKMAPLLEEILSNYSATGLPFAYQPKE